MVSERAFFLLRKTVPFLNCFCNRGLGALGGLSALGGIVAGSAVVMTGGAAVAFSGVLVTVATKAWVSTKSTHGARLLLEGRARQLIQACAQDSVKRKEIIAGMYSKNREDTTVEYVNYPTRSWLFAESYSRYGFTKGRAYCNPG